jgi:phosphoribosylanthranilate isomerase
MSRTRVLVSGIRDLRAAEAATEAGADAVGFDFRPGSPRHIDPYVASDVLAGLPTFMSGVAIYADPTLDDFLDAEAVCPAPYTLLHGAEKDGLVRRIGPDVIKAEALDLATVDGVLARWRDVDEVCAVMLVGAEGTDWPGIAPKLARSIRLSPVPVVLAGGLTPENVESLVRTVRPWGVSLALEEASGGSMPDAERVALFCHAVQRADFSGAADS